jgi:hypothetical protein
MLVFQPAKKRREETMGVKDNLVSLRERLKYKSFVSKCATGFC